MMTRNRHDARRLLLLLLLHEDVRVQRFYDWLGVPFLMHLLQKAKNEMVAMQVYEVPKVLMAST